MMWPEKGAVDCPGTTRVVTQLGAGPNELADNVNVIEAERSVAN